MDPDPALDFWPDPDSMNMENGSETLLFLTCYNYFKMFYILIPDEKICIALLAGAANLIKTKNFNLDIKKAEILSS